MSGRSVCEQEKSFFRKLISLFERFCILSPVVLLPQIALAGSSLRPCSFNGICHVIRVNGRRRESEPSVSASGLWHARNNWTSLISTREKRARALAAASTQRKWSILLTSIHGVTS